MHKSIQLKSNGNDNKKMEFDLKTLSGTKKIELKFRVFKLWYSSFQSVHNYSIFFLIWLRKNTGAKETMETNVNISMDCQVNTDDELVSVFRVVPAWMYIQDGGATPMNVPNTNGYNGMSMSGDVKFMNQLGTNGVIRKKIM